MESEEADNKAEGLKEGYYSVHVFLEESKGLLPVGKDNICNPIICVRCFGKQKCTKKLKTVGAATHSLWNEHMHFHKLCSASEIRNEQLLIEVIDSCLLKDSLIGSYDLDLTHIYYQKNHSITHQWIVLTNPYSDDISVMRGLLKGGISILHSKDKPVNLSTLESKEILTIPPQVKLKTIQLVIQILKAEHLPILDSMGTVDAFCLARFANVECKSSVITAEKTNLSVHWFEEISLPVILPNIADKVFIYVWDKDTMTQDDLVGVVKISWEKIGREAEFKWVNIYGAPSDVESEVAQQMNLCEENASHWRGRLLMRTFLTEKEGLTVKCNGIASKEMKQLVHNTFEVESLYQVVAQVFEAVNLPERTQSYSILVQFAQLKLQSKIVEAVDGHCHWFETLKLATVGIPNGAELPDVFIYLMDDKKPVCYSRQKARVFMDPQCTERWFKFIPDKAIGQVKSDWQGGHILLKVFISRHKEFKEILNKFKSEIKVPRTPIVKILVCNLYQCRALASADIIGLADPYVKVLCGTSEACTDKKALIGTLNPVWYKQLILKASFWNFESAPPAIVQVWDYDLLTSDDLIGVCLVPLKDLPINPEDYPRPEWRELTLGNKVQGEILASFSLFDSNVPPFLMPKFIDVSVEIFALGLRDLKPALDWLPVNKAFLKIDLRTVTYPGETLMVPELRTQPISTGKNPNIGAVLTFQCKIPKDPLLCPSISCNVHDYLLSGVSQPLIGTFTIDLAKSLLVRLGHRQSIIDLSVRECESPTNSKIPSQRKRESFSLRPITLCEAQDGEIVILPQYKEKGLSKKLVEVKFKNSHYMAIGYNKTPKEGNKHYRFILDSPLEKSQLFGKKPFNTFKIRKGQNRILPKAFSMAETSGKDSYACTHAGVFKGIVRIHSGKPTENEFERDGYERIAKLLVTKTQCIVRVYVIDAFDLMQKDDNSESDPYLKLKLGKERIIDRENFIENNANPKFFKAFELKTIFPGESTLKVQLWDRDRIKDDRIGETRIDLEDRYFSPVWSSYKEKPIETRKLKTKSCSQPQGFVRLWLEIHPLHCKVKPWNICPRPPEPLELRLIIWRCEGVKSYDIEGVSDLYVQASVNGGATKETDTHYRAQKGTASWNWRMKFQISAIEDSKYFLSMQLWDRDLFSTNDAIGDASIDLTEIVQFVLETGESARYYGVGAKCTKRSLREESEKVWVEVARVDEKGNREVEGKVLVSAELLTAQKAEAIENAEGRAEPNIEPRLPEPEDRIRATINPFKIASQMLGVELRRKMLMWLCLGFCCVLVLMMFPMLVADIISTAIFF